MQRSTTVRSDRDREPLKKATGLAQAKMVARLLITSATKELSMDDLKAKAILITGASTGRQPPLKPVPAPRGTKAISIVARQRTNPASSATVLRSPHTSGACCSSANPSHS